MLLTHFQQSGLSTLFLLGAVCLTPFIPASVIAQDQLREVQREYLDVIKPMLQKHCIECHSDSDAEAGLSLAGYETLDDLLNSRKKFKKVLNRVAAREMPPEDSDPIANDDHKVLMEWLDTLQNSVDCSIVNPGRVTIRRLNRNEYRNTIRDLVGVDYHPADSFPGDDVGYGFDNIADVLSLPPILMEKYLDAAEEITNQIIVDPESPSFRKTIPGLEFKSRQAGHEGMFVVLATESTVQRGIEIEKEGEYEVIVRAAGTPAKDEWPKMAFGINDKRLKTWRVDSQRDEPGDYSFKTRLRAREQTLEVSFLNDEYIPNVADRNLYVSQVEIRGPVGLTSFQKKILGYQNSKDRDDLSEEELRKITRSALNRFASRAYRRKAYSNEIDKLVRFYEMQVKEGESHEVALKHTLQAVLVSPFFLYKVERPTKPGQVRTLTDFELATSLSYFLWNSMPDEELLGVAGQRKLTNIKSYRNQVLRMMEDPKAEALVESFAAQWLQLGHLEHVRPDPDLFPGVSEELRRDMATETKMLVADLIKRDASIFSLLDSEYSFINKRLAEHYGIDKFRSEGFRRTDMAKYGRKGLMTHASILTLTSNPNRTSPVKRGKWIMENLLGEEPPPPDPEAMQLEDQAELTGTIRQRMEQHRANPNCAICHLVMDELGFALENYDAVGKWRDKDGSNEIDAMGELPDGTIFEGPDELQATLKSKMRDQFVRCLAEKMLIYALGRGLEYFDECALDKIIAQVKQDDYRFSSLIMAVATSDPFIKRQGPPVIEEKE